MCNWKDKQDALQASPLVFGPSQVFRGESSPWHLAARHLVSALFSLLAETNSLAISSFQLLISKAMKALSLLSNLVPYVMLWNSVLSLVLLGPSSLLVDVETNFLSWIFLHSSLDMGSMAICDPYNVLYIGSESSFAPVCCPWPGLESSLLCPTLPLPPIHELQSHMSCQCNTNIATFTRRPYWRFHSTSWISAFMVSVPDQ